MTPRWAFHIVPVLLFASSAAAGPLTFTFASSLLTAGRGQTVTFSATLMNAGSTALFLNSDAVNIAAPLIADDTKFFLNFPLSLAPSQSVTAPILDVTVPLSSPFGLYPGNFVVLGGATPSEVTNIGSATFAVNVVPEPATIGSLVGGGLFLWRLRRRRIRVLGAASGLPFKKAISFSSASPAGVHLARR
jgi:hypothetical protein